MLSNEPIVVASSLTAKMEVEPEHATPEVVYTNETQGQPEAEMSANDTRSDALHLIGVEELNTNAIETYLVEHYNKPFQIEWIDDSSLNIVYDDPEDAFQCLVAITSPAEFELADSIAPEQLRRTKTHRDYPEVELKARFALHSDKKTSGSRSRSRYYLLHGEPSRREDLARFGSKRSNPMKYGFKGRDIISRSKHEDRIRDLFPDKADGVSLDDVDMDADLLPNKATKRGSRGGQSRRNRRNRGKPDLFAGKLSEPRKTTSDRASAGAEKSNISQESNSQPTSIFQNMDY